MDCSAGSVLDVVIPCLRFVIGRWIACIGYWPYRVPTLVSLLVLVSPLDRQNAFVGLNKTYGDSASRDVFGFAADLERPDLQSHLLVVDHLAKVSSLRLLIRAMACLHKRRCRCFFFGGETLSNFTRFRSWMRSYR